MSTSRQATEGLSLDEQQRAVEAYIAGQCWEHHATLIEAGQSGRKDDRPELQKVMEAARRGDIQVLVIPKLDRLGRSTRHLLQVIEDLQKAGVRLISLGDSIDTSTASGRLLIGVLASVAEFESSRLGERVASVTAARAQQGKAHGRAPYGYRQAGSAGLTVEPAEAAVVQRVFGEYVAGRSQRQIARDLNRDGLKPQRSREWTQGTLSKVLSNPAYGGSVRLNGQEYDGLHEHIISGDLWAKATQLREASTRSDGGRGRTPVAGHVLAGGLLRCSCGSAMKCVTKPTRTPGVLYERYVCSSADTGARCPQPPVKRGPIDEAVWRFFVGVALDVGATRAAVEEAHDAKLAELAALRDQADLDAHRAQERLVRVRRDYADGRLDADDWASFRDEFTADMSASRAQVDRLDQHKAQLVDERSRLDTEGLVLDELAALRAMVVGEARDGSQRGADSFRAALRRMFAGFELLSSINRDGRVWRLNLGRGFDGPSGHGHDELNLPPEPQPDGTDLSYFLYPHIRPELITGWDAAESFPALKRAALALRASDTNGLQT